MNIKGVTFFCAASLVYSNKDKTAAIDKRRDIDMLHKCIKSSQELLSKSINLLNLIDSKTSDDFLIHDDKVDLLMNDDLFISHYNVANKIKDACTVNQEIKNLRGSR